MPTVLHAGCVACLTNHGEVPLTVEEQTLILLWRLTCNRTTVSEMTMDLCEPHRRKLRRLMDQAHGGRTD